MCLPKRDNSNSWHIKIKPTSSHTRPRQSWCYWLTDSCNLVLLRPKHGWRKANIPTDILIEYQLWIQLIYAPYTWLKMEHNKKEICWSNLNMWCIQTDGNAMYTKRSECYIHKQMANTSWILYGLITESVYISLLQWYIHECVCAHACVRACMYVLCTGIHTPKYPDHVCLPATLGRLAHKLIIMCQYVYI